MRRQSLLWVVALLWLVTLAACGGTPAMGPEEIPDSGDASADAHADAKIDADARGADVAADRQALPDAADARITVDAPDASVADANDASDGRANSNDASDARTDVASDGPAIVDSTVDAPRTDGASPDSGVVLRTVSITPSSPSIVRGSQQQLTATGTYSDSSTRDLTTTVTWQSSSTAIATVGATGIARAIAPGTTTISATQNGVTNSITFTVNAGTLQSIAVTPTNPSIADGTSISLTAVGTFSDNTTQDLSASATWSSSATDVATVNGRTAMSQSPGSTTISATFGGMTGSTTLTVSTATLVAILVSPDRPTIARQTDCSFFATGRYSNGTAQDLTTQVTWASSATGIATIGNDPGTEGIATGTSPGTTTISATLGSVAGSTTLTVTNATLTSITLSSFSMPRGTQGRPEAIGNFSDSSTQDISSTVTWDSSDSNIVSITNVAGRGHGVASALTLGTATITATQASVTGTGSITVTAALLQALSISPSAPSIANGTTIPFVATGIYSDNSTQNLTTSVTWGSSNALVASISNGGGTNGLATSVSPGTATISATIAGITSTTTLNVSPASLVSIHVDPSNRSLAKGTTQRFTATGVYTDNSTQDLTTAVVWESSNTNIASINNATGSQGLATAVGNGTLPADASISATLGGISGSTTLTVTPVILQSVSVTPTNPSTTRNTTVPFTATGTYSDGSTQDVTTLATWASSSPAFVSVSNSAGSEGIASALMQGGATITATYSGLTGSSNLTVTSGVLQSLALSPTNPSIAKGTTLQLAAIGTYSDNSTQNLTAQVTWGSSDGNVASVGNSSATRGLATGLAQGTTTITATVGSFTASTSLVVSNALLQAVVVTPVNRSTAVNITTQFFATGIYSDGSTQDLTPSATWSSTSDAIATVSNGAGTQGLVTAVSPGQVTLRATVGSAVGSSTLTVTNATLQAITVTPNAAAIANGSTLQFTATGNFSDGSTQNLTAQAGWLSTSTSVATVSSAAGSGGLSTAVGIGMTNIRASFGGFTGSTTLQVTNATLTTITIDPGDNSIANGTTEVFTASGHYSNGSTQDLSSSVTWSSSGTSIATISNASGSNGLARAVAVGNTTITATFGAATASVILSITNANLQTIAVFPSNQDVDVGDSVSYNATGQFSDGSSQDLTTQVTWSSSNGTVAIVSNAAGDEGNATTIAAGTTTIRAAFGGVSGTTSLTAAVPTSGP